MDSYHYLVIAPCTSMKFIEEVANYFRSLIFETTPPICLVRKDNEPGTFPIWAKQLCRDTPKLEHAVMWKHFTQYRYLLVLSQEMVSLELYASQLLSC